MKKQFWTDNERQLIKAYQLANTDKERNKIFSELLPAIIILINNQLYKFKILDYEEKQDLRQNIIIQVLNKINRIENFETSQRYITMITDCTIIDYLRLKKIDTVNDYSNIFILEEDNYNNIVINDIKAVIKVKLSELKQTINAYQHLELLFNYFNEEQFLNKNFSEYLIEKGFENDLKNKAEIWRSLKHLNISLSQVDAIAGKKITKNTDNMKE